ncbi:MAG: ATP-binding protein [Deltaproteobacteria bacterium]|jgi:hypothetical protein|nr:ATP-binding protein [Deltaproteobacteria bacterium]
MEMKENYLASKKTIGLGNIEIAEFVKNHSIYVDKTKAIFDLFHEDFNRFYITRPRRFGKTLLISAMQNILLGRRELFQDCYISSPSARYDWKSSHVIRLDLSSYGMDADKLELGLLEDLNEMGASFGVELKRYSSGQAIIKLIKTLHESYRDIPLPINGEVRNADIPQVAILVDEYDYPLFNLRDTVNQERTRQVLHDFFTAIKSVFDKVRFIFMTGVTKFSGLTISSGMNSLEDITFNPKYSSICGFTETEIDVNFGSYIGSISTSRSRDGNTGSLSSYEDIFAQIMDWYDGYSWDGRKFVINPVSLLNFLRSGQFKRYWYETGGPDFLEQAHLKDDDYFKLFRGNIAFKSEMMSTQVNTMSPLSILLQTGYLTIDRTSDMGDGSDDKVYLLTIPNREVRRSYADDYLIPKLFPLASDADKSGIVKRYIDFANAFRACDAEKTSELMSYIYADIAHQTTEHTESFYASHLVPALYYINGVTISQDSSGGGDADCVVLTLEGKIFVIEVKYQTYGNGKVRPVPADANDKKLKRLLDNGVRLAFRQIFRRGYALRFRGRGKEVIAVAVSVAGRIGVKIEFKTIERKP